MSNSHRLIELGIIMAVVIILTQVPLFILAKEVDGDEFVKSGLGLLAGGVASAIAVYRMWKTGKVD